MIPGGECNGRGAGSGRGGAAGRGGNDHAGIAHVEDFTAPVVRNEDSGGCASILSSGACIALADISPGSSKWGRLASTQRSLHLAWCGVVRCGVVRCGVVRCGVVWCGVVWRGVVWRGEVWCGEVWRGEVWRGVVWCGVAWCGVAW